MIKLLPTPGSTIAQGENILGRVPETINIIEITEKRACTVSGCIKAKFGEAILEKEKRSSMNFENRWVLRSALNFASDGEVVREVANAREQDMEIYEKRKGHEQLDEQQNGIVVEEIECLDEFGIEKVTEVLNQLLSANKKS
ncbi:hypothetical protein HELRODRAFT_159976 [Helobdella robusta]|uniref:Uncharacterized protein n=1 Tax=Helobdella robusta TaxID=6412 RepID=T1EPM1_HELRO|nr:hypothetical protein HELRODRAFT_159976 [Helobdella robusta]ESO05890.1 hypothetical protein HELRODRAFT_159976 [Helobdella robusta]